MEQLKYQKTEVDSLDNAEFKKQFKLYSALNFFYKDTQTYLQRLKIKLKYFSSSQQQNTSLLNEKYFKFILMYMKEITKDFNGDRMQLTVVPDPNLIRLEFRGMYPIELASQTVKFKKLVMDLWQEAIRETNIFLEAEAGAAGE